MGYGCQNKRNMNASENVAMHHVSPPHSLFHLLFCLPSTPHVLKSVSNTLFMFFESINNRVQIVVSNAPAASGRMWMCAGCVVLQFGLRCNNKLKWRRCECIHACCCCCCTASNLLNFSILNCNNLWVVMNCLPFLVSIYTCVICGSVFPKLEQ